MPDPDSVVRACLSPAARRIHLAKARSVGLFRACPTMTEAEGILILWYTSNASQAFLDRLRRHTETECDRNRSEVLAEAIGKLPRWSGSPIHRVIVVEAADVPTFVMKYAKGRTVVWPAITSCSASSAFRRHGNARFIVEHRSGRVIGPHSWHPDEHEVVLPPGCAFSVETIVAVDGSPVEVELQEVE